MQGRVYWLTGLSGAGKTTISNALVKTLTTKRLNVILLDGDEMREMLGVKGAFEYEERKKLSHTYSRLCRMLANQGHTIVCATISMFDDVRDWNRQHLDDYVEIYLKCDPETLRRRDEKGLYKKLESNQLNNIAGFDIQVEEPKTPDLIVENDGQKRPEQIVAQILQIKEFNYAD